MESCNQSKFDNNIGLVYYVFNKFFYGHRDVEEDLVQEGLLGLWKACKTYDSSMGTAFSTYAVTVIKNEMGMYVRKMLRRPKKFRLDDPVDPKDKAGVTFLNTIMDEREYERDDARILDMITKIAKERGYEEMLEMKMKGIKQVDIAKKLGIHQVTVSERMRYLYEETRKRLRIKK